MSNNATLACASCEPAAEPEKPSVMPRPAMTALRLLVVEDDVDGAESLALLLRLAGHDVQVAFTGPSALAAALAYKPAVVLLDIGLPGLNGYEVARRLRQQPGMKTAVVIALTGFGQESDRQQALEAGCDYHLLKPADPQLLQDFLTVLANGHEI